MLIKSSAGWRNMFFVLFNSNRQVALCIDALFIIMATNSLTDCHSLKKKKNCRKEKGQFGETRNSTYDDDGEWILRNQKTTVHVHAQPNIPSRVHQTYGADVVYNNTIYLRSIQRGDKVMTMIVYSSHRTWYNMLNENNDVH